MHFRVKHLAGHSHPSIWKLIELIKKEDVASRTIIRLNERGEPPNKRVRQETLRYNNRLIHVIQEYVNGQRLLGDCLRTLGHNIRFGVQRLQDD